MEEKESTLKVLLDSAENYVKTSYELFKLKAIESTTEKLSSVLSRLVILFFFFMFVLMASIALSFWLGHILGNSWLGFLIVAGFYIFTGIILYFFAHEWFKRIIANLIVKETFK